MNPTAADSTLTATILLGLGASLLVLAWALRRARRDAWRKLDSRAMLARAEALVHGGHTRDACALLNRAVTAHPHDSALLYRLARCQCALGQGRLALGTLKRACDLDPNWAVSAMHDPDLRAIWRQAAA